MTNKVQDINMLRVKKQGLWYGIDYLLPYLKTYRKYFLFIFIAMAIVAATSALTAYIFKYMLNGIFIAKDEMMLIILPIIVIALFLLRGVSRFASSYLTSSIGLSVANDLRKRLFDHLLAVEYHSLSKITSGDINALLIQTVLNIQNTIAKTIPQLIISILTVMALVVVILYTNWSLALYAIFVGILIVVPVKILGKGVKRHTRKSESMVIEMANRTNETFNNLDLVKVYSNEHHESLLFSSFLDGYKRFQLKLAKYQLLSSPFMELFIAIAIAVVIYIGGYSVIEDRMTPGDFFAFLVALTMLYAPIKSLTQNIMSLYMLNGYVDRIQRVLELPIESDISGKQEMDCIESIRFDNVHYSIGDSAILQDISFDINRGDSIAIVGRSGAGKSSIISLIFGLGRHSKGEILINGRPIQEYDSSSLRGQISYVNQRAGVFNDTIEANILYGEPMDRDRYEKAKQDAQCDFIEQLPNKDQTIAGEFGSNLSGGQRQRIALARAIYRDGSLFVLDEATSALDADTENLIQESLQSVMKDRTSIIIAHRLSTVEKCNKVIVLEEGKIVVQGSYGEISQSEAFRKNFMLKIEEKQ